MSEETKLNISADNLLEFMTQAMVNAGMDPQGAAYSADCLLKTNLWGIDSHGVFRLPIYLERLQNGAINGNPDIKAATSFGALEVLNGDDGMGFVVGHAAMNRAIELAKEHGVGCVGAMRSNHFGAAALFAREAAEAGMVGLAMTNVGPLMVVPGGSKPIAGNNPMAIAAPTYSEFPFVMDISLSQVAGGKILLAAKEGKKIPLDWAADKDGRPTDDPEVGYAGYLLPMGGHKGFALSLAVDIMCGIMTGGAFSFGIKSMYKVKDAPSETGHMMIAINSSALMPQDEFGERMAKLKGYVKDSPMWDENREMLLPGEIEYRSELERRQNGIPLASGVVEELNGWGEKLGTASRLTPLS